MRSPAARWPRSRASPRRGCAKPSSIAGLELRYEAGELSSHQFYDEFCHRTGTRPGFDALAFAAGSIFAVNHSLTPVVAQLQAAGYRLGLLSNTCEMHWDYFARGRYALIPEIFETVTLSFRVGAVKPDPKIYAAAAAAAGVRPDKIFFTDDTPGHVAAAPLWLRCCAIHRYAQPSARVAPPRRAVQLLTWHSSYRYGRRLRSRSRSRGSSLILARQVAHGDRALADFSRQRASRARRAVSRVGRRCR